MAPIFRRSILIFAVLFAGQFLEIPSPKQPGQTKAASRSVLFIGNSMTSVHDIPGIVEKLSRSPGCRAGPVRALRHTPGGKWLAQHWEEGAAIRIMTEQHPAMVVIQEQSDVTLNFSDMRKEYTARFVNLAHELGITPLVYQIDIGWWSDAERSRIWQDDQLLREALNAQNVNAISLFRILREEASHIRPFASDNHHLSLAGAGTIAYALAQKICNPMDENKQSNQFTELPLQDAFATKPKFIWQLWLPAWAVLSADEIERIEQRIQHGLAGD